MTSNILGSRERPSEALRAQFGDIDIYLFDQILKGRFDARPRVLDAGCGDGRNLVYFLRTGFTCHGVDADAGAVAAVQRLALELAPLLPSDHFRQAGLEQLPYPDASMDAVVCSAVLHFADDAAQFGRMVKELWRVLAPGGLFFARLATNIGIEDRVPVANARVRLPDGSDRFVVDAASLMQWTDRLDARLADPIKTTNVQHLRCMTTWCMFKE
jgi:SAM-dependent methyltransferase